MRCDLRYLTRPNCIDQYNGETIDVQSSIAHILVQRKIQYMQKQHEPYSIIDFSRSKFSMHGTVNANIEGKILTFEITGPFNDQLMNSLLEYQAKIFKDWNPQGKFGILSSVKKNMLLSPSAFDIWAISNDVEGRSFVVPKMQIIYQKAGLDIKFFENESLARAFLEKALELA